MKRVGAVALALCLVGCGRRHSGERTSAPLTFERMGDTSGLAQGAPLLTHLTPYRMPDGSLRVRGMLDMPDGVRLQISIYRKDPNRMVGRVQVLTEHHGFDSPPIRPDEGPLPHGRYRFEYFAPFNPAWQRASVMTATHDGRDLRGPGMTHDLVGAPMFYLVEERTL